MLRKILIGLGVVVAAFVVVVAARPARFHIERAATIAARPETVFAHVNDFHAWAAWSPWEKIDPAMQRTYGGPRAGIGSTYAWDGDAEVGKGRMEIVQSVPFQVIAIKLDFVEPMEATNAAVFLFAPVPEGTQVTWRMQGEHGFAGKAFSLLMDMDRLVGAQFERGLTALKGIAEAEAKRVAAAGGGRQAAWR